MKKKIKPEFNLILDNNEEKRYFFDGKAPKYYFVCIPKNNVIPEFGYMQYADFANLLRKYCNKPRAIYFLADMM